MSNNKTLEGVGLQWSQEDIESCMRILAAAPKVSVDCSIAYEELISIGNDPSSLRRIVASRLGRHMGDIMTREICEISAGVRLEQHRDPRDMAGSIFNAKAVVLTPDLYDQLCRLLVELVRRDSVVYEFKDSRL